MTKTLGDLIKEAREKKKISQRELARRIGVDNSYINIIEKGEAKKPGYMILFNICSELELDSEEEYNLFIKAGYTDKEMYTLGIISNYGGMDDLENYVIKSGNKTVNIDIHKALEDFKKGYLQENEIIELAYVYTVLNRKNAD